MIIFCIGCAICQAVIFNASINIFPEIKGTASSAVSFIRAFIMAIFIGLTSYVYNGQTISKAPTHIIIITENEKIYIPIIIDLLQTLKTINRQ